MGEVRENEAYEEEVLDYEEEDEKAPDSINAKPAGESVKEAIFFINFFMDLEIVKSLFFRQNMIRLLISFFFNI
mgnify:FL=1